MWHIRKTLSRILQIGKLESKVNQRLIAADDRVLTQSEIPRMYRPLFSVQNRFTLEPRSSNYPHRIAIRNEPQRVFETRSFRINSIEEDRYERNLGSYVNSVVWSPITIYLNQGASRNMQLTVSHLYLI